MNRKPLKYAHYKNKKRLVVSTATVLAFKLCHATCGNVSIIRVN